MRLPILVLFASASLVTCGGIIGCASQPSCNSVPPGQQRKISLSTGVWGVAKAYDGDFMPTVAQWSLIPKAKPCRGTISPIRGEIGIFTSITQQEASWSWSVPAVRSPIATVSTDWGGFFEVSLDPGTYSIFLRKDTGWYVSMGSGDNPPIFNKVIVLPGRMTEFNIEDRSHSTW